MITLSSTPIQMKQEMEWDFKKLLYWQRKSLNKKEYRKERLAARKRAEETRMSQLVGEPQEWKSENGNRWYYQNMISRNPVSGGLGDSAFCFIYYETYGSIGAFVPSFDPYTNGAVMEGGPIIFTSHFFLRYCERMGLQMRSRDIVAEFIKEQTRFDVKAKRDEKGNVKGIDVQLLNGVGRGVITRKGDVVVWEVRTFIPYKMLTKKQREGAVISYSFDPMDDKHKHWFLFLCRPLCLELDNPHLANIYVSGVGEKGWLQVSVTVLSAIGECKKRLERKFTMKEIDGVIADERVGMLVRELAVAADGVKPGAERPQDMKTVGTLTFDLALAIADHFLHKGWYSCRVFLEDVTRSRYESALEPYHGECGAIIEHIGYVGHAKELGYEISELVGTGEKYEKV